MREPDASPQCCPPAPCDNAASPGLLLAHPHGLHERQAPKWNGLLQGYLILRLGQGPEGQGFCWGTKGQPESLALTS